MSDDKQNQGAKKGALFKIAEKVQENKLLGQGARTVWNRSGREGWAADLVSNMVGNGVTTIIDKAGVAVKFVGDNAGTLADTLDKNGTRRAQISTAYQNAVEQTWGKLAETEEAKRIGSLIQEKIIDTQAGRFVKDQVGAKLNVDPETLGAVATSTVKLGLKYSANLVEAYKKSKDFKEQIDAVMDVAYESLVAEFPGEKISVMHLKKTQNSALQHAVQQEVVGHALAGAGGIIVGLTEHLDFEKIAKSSSMQEIKENVLADIAAEEAENGKSKSKAKKSSNPAQTPANNAGGGGLSGWVGDSVVQQIKQLTEDIVLENYSEVTVTQGIREIEKALDSHAKTNSGKPTVDNITVGGDTLDKYIVEMVQQNLERTSGRKLSGKKFQQLQEASKEIGAAIADEVLEPKALLYMIGREKIVNQDLVVIKHGKQASEVTDLIREMYELKFTADEGKVAEFLNDYKHSAKQLAEQVRNMEPKYQEMMGAYFPKAVLEQGGLEQGIVDKISGIKNEVADPTFKEVVVELSKHSLETLGCCSLSEREAKNIVDAGKKLESGKIDVEHLRESGKFDKIFESVVDSKEFWEAKSKNIPLEEFLNPPEQGMEVAGQEPKTGQREPQAGYDSPEVKEQEKHFWTDDPDRVKQELMEDDNLLQMRKAENGSSKTARPTIGADSPEVKAQVEASQEMTADERLAALANGIEQVFGVKVEASQMPALLDHMQQEVAAGARV